MNKTIQLLVGICILFVLTGTPSIVSADKSTGYRITIFQWVPELFGLEISPYTVVAISPTRDGKIHINNSGDFESWYFPGASGQAPEVVGDASDNALRKWAENLALTLQNGIMDGYVDHKLIQRDSQLHHDLMTKESILDGRSAIISMIQNDKVMASIRYSFSDPKSGHTLLPAEMRTPGGPREIFPAETISEHDVKFRNPSTPEPVSWDNGFRDRGIYHYQKGGKPAELKNLLNRKEGGLDLLPMLIKFLGKSNFHNLVPLDLGIPTPNSTVGETTLTLFNKIYNKWGFKLVGHEADPTLGDELVHMQASDSDFSEKVYTQIIETRIVAPLDEAYESKDETAFAKVIRDPTRRIFQGHSMPALDKIITGLVNNCAREMGELPTLRLSDLFSIIKNTN